MSACSGSRHAQIAAAEAPSSIRRARNAQGGEELRTRRRLKCAFRSASRAARCFAEQARPAGRQVRRAAGPFCRHSPRHRPTLRAARSDLYPTKTIDVVDMVLGVSIVAPLLDGQQSLDIRAGVQPDTMLRIVGRGLPSFGGGPHGDLYVRLQVRVPERLTDRPRRLYEQLKASSRSEPS